MNYLMLGQNIKKYRHLAGMRQEDLAEICECSASHIGQIEHARTIPSLEMTMRIANALSVTIDQLVRESYSHPEYIYLKELAGRIEGYPLELRLVACETMKQSLDSLEKFSKMDKSK